MTYEDALKIADMADSQEVTKATLTVALQVLATRTRQYAVVHKAQAKVIEFWREQTAEARRGS